MLLVACLAAPGGAPAVPDAGALAATCHAALTATFTGPDAAACTWYLEPCASCAVDAAAPAACPPATFDEAARARLFLEHLAARPHDAARPAPAVVAELLAARFPCLPAGSP